MKDYRIVSNFLQWTFSNFKQSHWLILGRAWEAYGDDDDDDDEDDNDGVDDDDDVDNDDDDDDVVLIMVLMRIWSHLHVFCAI